VAGSSDGRRVRLEIRGVSVVFRTPKGQHTALRDVSLDLHDGEKLVLLGPSGCGKSTLLKVIACFEPPSAGTVRLDGVPCTKPAPDRTVIFQEFDQLFPWKSVRENVAYALRVTGRARGRDAEARAVEFLRMVGLERFLDFHPHALSGGMKQRVAIARALALDPEVLLMDEPFGALDAQTRATLQGELHRLQAQAGKPLLFVTHSIEEAIVLGDRIAVMTPGPGRIKEVLGNPRTGLDALGTPRASALHREIRALLEFDLRGGAESRAAAAT
jgi:NitT/TauT family transport system ATP-binding protein